MSATQVSTSFENITYEVKGSIGYITLNRPKVMNALNRRTIEELSAAFHAAKKDATVKGIILTGTGEKAFIAGADIAVELERRPSLPAPISRSFRQSTGSRQANSPRRARRCSCSLRRLASL